MNGTELLDKYVYRKDIHALVDRIDSHFVWLKNEISIEMIELLIEKENEQEVISSICDKYSVNEEIVANDLKMLLDRLKKKDLYIDNKSSGGVSRHINIDSLDFPLAVEVEITKRCNWNCRFCYNVWKYDNALSDSEVDLPIDSYKLIIDEMIQNNCYEVRLSGGEPTLSPFFVQMLEYNYINKVSTILFTNGSTIDKNMIDILKKYGVRRILISLHAQKKAHDAITMRENSYDETVRIIERLVQEGFDIGVESILIGNQGTEEYITMANILIKIGVSNWNLMPYVSTNDENDILYMMKDNQLKEILDRLNAVNKLKIRVVCSPKHCYCNGEKYLDNSILDNSCGAGVLWLSISNGGLIRHCPHSNIYAGTVSDGIRNVYINKIKPKILHGITYEKKCYNCKRFILCKGGCYLNKIREY